MTYVADTSAWSKVRTTTRVALLDTFFIAFNKHGSVAEGESTIKLYKKPISLIRGRGSAVKEANVLASI